MNGNTGIKALPIHPVLCFDALLGYLSGNKIFDAWPAHVSDYTSPLFVTWYKGPS
jgi:hypothetical protein